MQTSLQDPDFSSFWRHTQKWMSGSYSSSFFQLLEKLFAVFHRGCTNLHPYQSAQGFLSPPPLPTLVLLYFDDRHSNRWCDHLIVVLICISDEWCQALFSVPAGLPGPLWKLFIQCVCLFSHQVVQIFVFIFVYLFVWPAIELCESSTEVPLVCGFTFCGFPVTCHQPEVQNIGWKTPEVNNS